jgi:hypothetical protein
VNQAPIALALVVCDAIYRESATGKFTLLGTFNSIRSNTFPCVHPQFAVYTILTDSRGKTPAIVRIVDAEAEGGADRPPIAEASFEVVLASPLDVAEVAGEFRNITFARSGQYRVQLWSREWLLLERRLMLFGPEDPQRSPPPESD